MAHLSHLDEEGNARMVNVAHKPLSKRTATAQAIVHTAAIAQVIAGDMPKGDVLGTAKIAGIMAAKHTSDLIPMCHPLAIHGVDVQLQAQADTASIHITATITTVDRTGVEMEALTAASVAALTCFDMIKAVDPLATITNIEVLAKSGGKIGDWHRPGFDHDRV